MASVRTIYMCKRQATRTNCLPVVAVMIVKRGQGVGARGSTPAHHTTGPGVAAASSLARLLALAHVTPSRPSTPHPSPLSPSRAPRDSAECLQPVSNQVDLLLQLRGALKVVPIHRGLHRVLLRVEQSAQRVALAATHSIGPRLDHTATGARVRAGDGSHGATITGGRSGGTATAPLRYFGHGGVAGAGHKAEAGGRVLGRRGRVGHTRYTAGRRASALA
mmetsp:Transcript_24862/g.78184  ORF Transcript_24862/g.78184 Transcript_24862/m.78184 type:complete len:220 (+) Transcript_24862:1456-2115(+)|eukprot:scaffold15602_cov99-Isochrysis_galbana.AAC.2